MVSVSMTMSDLEQLSEVLNDMKHCAVSLRQLSFLLSRPAIAAEILVRFRQ